MRRLIMLGLLLFCMAAVGCGTFSTLTEKEFWSNDNTMLKAPE